MHPYRAPGQLPRAPKPLRWRERLGAAARVLIAIVLPLAVGWLVTIEVRRARCAAVDYVRILWGAPGVAIACSVGVMFLLLTGVKRQ
ncbi:hypothetical protein ACMHYB_06990 [Sorangium sp. So ce1128]